MVVSFRSFLIFPGAAILHGITGNGQGEGDTPLLAGTRMGLLKLPPASERWEKVIFSVCQSTPGAGGGGDTPVPGSFLGPFGGRGTLVPGSFPGHWSQVLSGGVPQSWPGGYPSQAGGGDTTVMAGGQDGVPPSQGGVPPPWDSTSERALATRRAVCLLRSRRMTFLFRKRFKKLHKSSSLQKLYFRIFFRKNCFSVFNLQLSLKLPKRTLIARLCSEGSITCAVSAHINFHLLFLLTPTGYLSLILLLATHISGMWVKNWFTYQYSAEGCDRIHNYYSFKHRLVLMILGRDELTCTYDSDKVIIWGRMSATCKSCISYHFPFPW